MTRRAISRDWLRNLLEHRWETPTFLRLRPDAKERCPYSTVGRYPRRRAATSPLYVRFNFIHSFMLPRCTASAGIHVAPFSRMVSAPGLAIHRKCLRSRLHSEVSVARGSGAADGVEAGAVEKDEPPHNFGRCQRSRPSKDHSCEGFLHSNPKIASGVLELLKVVFRHRPEDLLDLLQLRSCGSLGVC